RWFNSIGKGDSAGPETSINLALGNTRARFSSNFARILRSAGTACRFTVPVTQVTQIQSSVVWKGKAEQLNHTIDMAHIFLKEYDVAEIISGVTIPDSKLAQEATELVREFASQLIYDHSRRVYVLGALRGQRDGISYDPELLYVGAMFHDLGLTDKYARDDQRFEIDGADEARRFLLSHGVADVDADKVWNAIALHTTPEIPLHMAAEVALVTRGVEHDVLGIGFDTITEEQR